MRRLKRTYVLPPETLAEFEQKVGAGKRGAVIADLLRDWLERQRREQLRREVIEGCREMGSIYQEIEREYHPLEEEVHRALDSEPPARRRRPRTARSG
jgi:hypothetical protein